MVEGFKRVRYTIDFSKFKLGGAALVAVSKAFKVGLKETISKEDNPKWVTSPTLIQVEFDGDPKQIEKYKHTLWGLKRTYGVAGIDFKFEEVK